MKSKTARYGEDRRCHYCVNDVTLCVCLNGMYIGRDCIAEKKDHNGEKNLTCAYEKIKMRESMEMWHFCTGTNDVMHDARRDATEDKRKKMNAKNKYLWIANKQPQRIKCGKNLEKWFSSETHYQRAIPSQRLRSIVLYFSQSVVQPQEVPQSAKKNKLFSIRRIMAALPSMAFVLCASIFCSVISATPQYRQQQVRVQPLESSSTPVAILSQSDENLPDGSFSSS